MSVKSYNRNYSASWYGFGHTHTFWLRTSRKCIGWSMCFQSSVISTNKLFKNSTKITPFKIISYTLSSTDSRQHHFWWSMHIGTGACQSGKFSKYPYHLVLPDIYIDELITGTITIEAGQQIRLELTDTFMGYKFESSNRKKGVRTFLR